MNKKDRKLKNFTDLDTWKKGHKLVLKIYEITDKFPKKETYSLVDQMRRSSVSVTSNIAEGFSRTSKKDKVHFYTMASGSLTELQNQLIISRDVGYLKEDSFKKLYDLTIQVHKLINGLVKSTKKSYS